MLEKIVALSGDVTFENFGLSPSDLNLLIENVSVVFNLAATVRFDEELKSALKMNVKGPRCLLEICRKMKHLDVRNLHTVPQNYFRISVALNHYTNCTVVENLITGYRFWLIFLPLGFCSRFYGLHEC